MHTPRIGEMLSGWPRRLLALGCLLLAGLSALGARHRPETTGPTTDVVISAAGLAPGHLLVAADVRTVRWPTQLRPTTALSNSNDVVGRRLAGPLAVGDVLTAERLIGSDLTTNLPSSMIAAPIPLADASAASLIRAGNFVDLLSTAGEDADAVPAQVIAQGVLVLAVLPPSPVSGGGSAELFVAVDRATELRIAQVANRPLVATVAKPP